MESLRRLLLKLERAGHIRLPPRIRPSSNGLRNHRAPVVALECEPVRGLLRDLQPLMNNTRFQAEIKTCSCGHLNKAAFPEGVNLRFDKVSDKACDKDAMQMRRSPYQNVPRPVRS